MANHADATAPFATRGVETLKRRRGCDTLLVDMVRRPFSAPSAAPPPPAPLAALTYVSTRGETWYLHEGITKTGKARYFVARTQGAGALAAMPPGREFRESINSVVSVARVDIKTARVAPADLDGLVTEVKRHRHLLRHKVVELKGALVVHEPHGMGAAEIAGFAVMLGLDPSALGSLPPGRVHYTRVLKFEPESPSGRWSVYRWVFRGEGFWHWLGQGSLTSLAREYLPVVGTEAFYELI